MRVNIQVDVKEKDVIEKQIKKELEGVAREIARKAMREELDKEINRLIDVKLAEAKKSGYYNEIANTITRILSVKISDDIKINTDQINRQVATKVEVYLDNKIQPYGGMEEFIKNYINKSIAEALQRV